MKFPKEIRQYLWENFQAKEVLREKLYVERCKQMEVSNKFIKNENVIINSSDLALMNNKTKYKILKENKKIENNYFTNEVSHEQNAYIQGLKNEIKIKSLKKFIKEKSILFFLVFLIKIFLLPTEISISDSEILEYDYPELLDLISKSHKNNFYISSKSENKSKKNNEKLPNEKDIRMLNSPYFHFDFGNSQEDKRKDLRKKLKIIGVNNINIFIKPKVNLAKQLMKKNFELKEKSLKKTKDFANYYHNFSFSKMKQEGDSSIYHKKGSCNSKFMENMKKINKKLTQQRTNEKDLQILIKEPKSTDLTVSSRTFTKRPTSEYRFYEHLLNKKKDHQRIFSARSTSKKENSFDFQEENLFFETSRNLGSYSARESKEKNHLNGKFRAKSSKVNKN